MQALLDEMRRHAGTLVTVDLGRTIIARNLPRSESLYDRFVRNHSSLHGARRYERRFQQDRGEIRYFHSPRGQTLESVLADCRTVEGNSWQSGAHTTFSPASNFEFWKQVAETAIPQAGSLDVWLAYIDGQPVANRFTVTVGATRHALVNEYDKRYGKYRLGTILFLHDLRNCIERGIDSIDMQPGNLHYKSQRGGAEEDPIIEAFGLPPNILGRVLTGILSIAIVKRRLQKKLMGE
jgi:CelD/BcsL family acetyltransferase involved in cellulose biosynthesis